MRVVLDVEADGLTPTQIWCVVCKDIDSDRIYSFDNQRDFRTFIDNATCTLVVSHNGIGYDWPVLARLWNVHFPHEVCRDTLVLSRLLDQGIIGGHSLEAWGERLGFAKGDFKDFDRYTPEMLEYCINDVHLNHKLYLYLVDKFRFPSWERSIIVEHEMAFICQEMHDNGFTFNEPRAQELLGEIQSLLKELDDSILDEFKPKKVLVRSYVPKINKDGSWGKKYYQLFQDPMVEYEDGLLKKYEWEHFNPQSPKQVIDRIGKYWNPFEMTDSHKDAIKLKDKDRLKHFKIYGYKINEANLGTLTDDAPEACKLLVKRIMLGARERILVSWLAAYNKDTGKIHGSFNSIGTWTHRLSHTNPNLGNVSAEKTIKYKGEELRKLAIYYGGEFRKLFTANPGGYLVGTDMEGAHLRLFAHFIKDEAFISALVNGDKKLGTDPHSINKRILGDICPDRDLAKTFIFTFLNGGGVNKVREIFGIDLEPARNALDGFISSYPGLVHLRDNVFPKDVERGYFVGLDGRKVPCKSQHLMMAGYLQNGEAVVMKHANVLWQREIKALGIPFKQVNLVHDEFQTEAYTEDEAKKIGQVQAQAIAQIGLDLGLVCPLAGEYVIGRDWLESH